MVEYFKYSDNRVKLFLLGFSYKCRFFKTLRIGWLPNFHFKWIWKIKRVLEHLVFKYGPGKLNYMQCPLKWLTPYVGTQVHAHFNSGLFTLFILTLAGLCDLFTHLLNTQSIKRSTFSVQVCPKHIFQTFLAISNRYCNADYRVLDFWHITNLN